MPAVPAPAPAVSTPAPAVSSVATASAPPPEGPVALLAAMSAQARPSLAQSLRSARAREDGDTLVIEVPADFATFASMHVDDYRELARKAAGRPVKVRVEALPAALPQESAPEEKGKQVLVEQATQEPAVQEVLDLFGGRVVEVREAKP